MGAKTDNHKLWLTDRHLNILSRKIWHKGRDIMDEYLEYYCKKFETYPELQRHYELDAGLILYKGQLAVIITNIHEYTVKQWQERNLGRAQFAVIGADWDDYAPDPNEEPTKDSEV